MGLQKLLLILAHSFICLGILFLYKYHVRSAFEAQTDITVMSKMEREALFRGEDALYYHFYKVIAKAPNFATGIFRLIHLNGIEYPHTVNVLHKFYVLPEVVIGGLYHMMRLIPPNILHSKLSVNDNNYLTMDHNNFNNNEMEFYLECVWFVGAFTVVLVYLHGVSLSGHISGGVRAFVSYFMLHTYASRIYERPAARENFGFPAIYMQMLYISAFINNMSKRRSSFLHFIKMTNLVLVTSVALACWQLSTIIFASQILILLLPWTLHTASRSALIDFNCDYSMSQFLGIALAYHWSAYNKRYFFTWQLAPAFALLLIPLLRLIKSNSSTNQTDSNNEQSVRVIPLGICLALLSHSTILDIFQATGYIKPFENTYTIYRDLLLHWGLNAKVNFATTLLACKPEYKSMELYELWEFADELVLKPYSLHWMLGISNIVFDWFRTIFFRTKCFKNPKMKYVLENFLEEHQMNMNDLMQKKNKIAFTEFTNQLAQYNYDYELYKKKKNKSVKNTTSEHTAFINDVKRLKQQIDDNKKLVAQMDSDEKSVETEDSSQRTVLSQSETDSHGNLISAPTTASTAPTAPTATDATTASTAPNEPNEPNALTAPVASTAPNGFRSLPFFHLSNFPTNYFRYSVLQMLVFAVIGVSIRKLFFLCFTQACILTSLATCSLSKLKLGSLYWLVCINTLVVIIATACMNIQKEYYPNQNRNKESQAMDYMLHWIATNTEKDAVFAGPIDVIGTVHLTTGRPIVNHAHLDMKHISERTEHVYSVFSRQQLTDIYDQYSQLKIQYLIVSLNDCKNQIRDQCDLLSIWDDLQPAFRNQAQFCSEMIIDKTPASWNVYINDHYAIVMMFSQSVQIHLKEYKLAEHIM